MAKAGNNPVDGCAGCRFFHLDAPADEAGFCRRYPPVFVVADGDAEVSYPVVEPTDWCGEFKRLEH